MFFSWSLFPLSGARCLRRQRHRDAEHAGWSALLAAGRPCWEHVPGDRAFAHVAAPRCRRNVPSASRR